MVKPDPFRAFVVSADTETFSRGVVELPLDALPSDGVLVRVHWSSVNYKDALAGSPDGRVARISPLVLGIDLAGVVLESDLEEFRPGDEVIAHGYDLGVARHGGYAELARIPAEWLVPLPTSLSAEHTMALGTAGYTAAAGVIALERHGMSPSDGPVLVTGATGGVGSITTTLLAQRGYEVVASTRKREHSDLLRDLGAADIVDPADWTKEQRPLAKGRWAGAVDTVGGPALQPLLAQIAYGGAVATCGNAGGPSFDGSVYPFILRGVSLLGIDSVQVTLHERRGVWERMADDLRPARLERLTCAIALTDVAQALDALLSGAGVGRYVVRIDDGA